MACLIDTDVAIHVRNRDPLILEHFVALSAPPFLSVVSQVEMEGGIHAQPALAAERRRTLNILMATVQVLPFAAAEAAAYGRIVAVLGFSRRKVADRMIAATALSNDLAMITMNERDFRDVPGLSLEVWPSPRA